MSLVAPLHKSLLSPNFYPFFAFSLSICKRKNMGEHFSVLPHCQNVPSLFVTMLGACSPRSPPAKIFVDLFSLI